MLYVLHSKLYYTYLYVPRLFAVQLQYESVLRYLYSNIYKTVRAADYRQSAVEGSNTVELIQVQVPRNVFVLKYEMRTPRTNCAYKFEFFFDAPLRPLVSLSTLELLLSPGVERAPPSSSRSTGTVTLFLPVLIVPIATIHFRAKDFIRK